METTKKKKQKGNLVIFLFPYLFFDKEQTIDGYTLKPSYTEIFKKESNRVRGHLTKIAKSFKFQNTQYINQYTYGWTTVRNKEEWEKLRNFLDTLSTLLRYQELSENRGVNYTNFDYAVFEIYKPMSKGRIDYYDGVLNGYNNFPIHYPETQFQPNFSMRPYILHTEGNSQVLTHLFHFWNAYYSKEERDRIIRALDWFNKSYKSDPEVDNWERFISVAIAFEALFNSPAESIQASLVANVTTLMGETEEMQHWLKDFYNLRSRIVHGKDKPQTYYKGKGTVEFHIDHLTFAQKVFTRCIRALFATREKVYTKDLHSELISNERRIKEILTTIKKAKDVKMLYENSTFHKIDELSQRDGTGKLKDVIEISKYLLPHAKKLLQKYKKNDLVKEIDNILSDDGKDLGGLAVKYSELHSHFSPVYFGDNTVSEDIHILSLKSAIYTFSSYASWKLFREAFERKRG